MPEAVIVAAARSAIGRAGKGSFVDTRPDDLLARVFGDVIGRSGVDPADIDDVIVGCTMPYGEAQALNTTRGVGFLAGLPDTVPATVVNRFCSSSLQAIRMAYHAIKAGEGDTFLVGGVESVSRSQGPPSDAEGAHPRLIGENAIVEMYLTMGETAERVADRFGVTRDDMDLYAQQSQERAVRSQKDGVFEREIVPFTKPDGTVVALDDGPRPDSTLERLQQLKPVFRADGRVTAGNSCPLNDGAAAVMVMAEDKARAVGATPLVRIRSTGVTGLDPAIMGVGPIEAVRQALGRAGLVVGDIDVLELNEAFASQVLAVTRTLGIEPFGEVLNPHGGAIALGHPFGMTGTRIMTTLINDLQTLDKEIGVETMCVGGGQGLAMVVERV